MCFNLLTTKKICYAYKFILLKSSFVMLKNCEVKTNGVKFMMFIYKWKLYTEDM